MNSLLRIHGFWYHGWRHGDRTLQSLVQKYWNSCYWIISCYFFAYDSVHVTSTMTPMYINTSGLWWHLPCFWDSPWVKQVTRHEEIVLRDTNWLLHIQVARTKTWVGGVTEALVSGSSVSQWVTAAGLNVSLACGPCPDPRCFD